MAYFKGSSHEYDLTQEADVSHDICYNIIVLELKMFTICTFSL